MQGLISDVYRSGPHRCWAFTVRADLVKPLTQDKRVMHTNGNEFIIRDTDPLAVYDQMVAKVKRITS